MTDKSQKSDKHASNKIYSRFMERGDASAPKRKPRSRQGLANHFDLFSVFSIRHARTLFQVASLPKISGIYSRISWKCKNVTPRFICSTFSTKFLRWYRQVTGSCLEKTQSRRSENSWGDRRLHDPYGSFPSFATLIRVLEGRKNLAVGIVEKNMS